MSKMLSYLKAAGGEASLMTRLGFWRQAVSLTVDQLVDLVQLISGGGLLPATGTTQGSRPLSGYNTALLQTGDEVFVQGVNELYYFDATSALTADGLNVVNAVGPGQFIRSSSVITQADWYVDSVNGDDENPGTAAAPLQTLGELFRRWSGKNLLSSIAAATITLLGTFPSEVLALSGVEVQRGQSLVLRPATLTEVASGTITTYTARNAAADTSATILADISFAGLAQARIRLTSGASAGATAWIGADLGGNTCRVGAFQLNGGAVTPANGVTFVVETYPTAVGGVTIQYVGAGHVRVEDFEVRQISTGQPQYLIGGGLGSSTTLFEAGAQVYRCKFTVGSRWYYGTTLTGCCSTAPMIAASGQYIMQGHTWFSAMTLRDNASLTLQGPYVTFDSVNVSIPVMQVLTGSVLGYAADIEFFGCVSTVAGLALAEFASAYSSSSARSVYGSGNTFPTAALVRSGTGFVYTTKPTIVGTVQDALVGGTARAWAAIPYIEPANNAMIVVRA